VYLQEVGRASDYYWLHLKQLQGIQLRQNYMSGETAVARCVFAAQHNLHGIVCIVILLTLLQEKSHSLTCGSAQAAAETWVAAAAQALLLLLLLLDHLLLLLPLVLLVLLV
jgi:hypothetical protein